VGERLREVEDLDLVGWGERRLLPWTRIEVEAATVWGTACCLVPVDWS
jgi:hypothetical protein